MTTALKSQTAPPAPTATAVRAHAKTLALALDALQAAAPALALESAKGQFGAKDALQNLIWKMKTIEFELELSDRVVALAMAEDAAAEAAWRSAIQTLDAEEVIAGIGKEKCCSRCTPGVHCVITAAAPHAGGTCGHPVLSQHLQYLDETGRRHFRYEDDPRCQEIYAAASRRLKISDRSLKYG
jgi:hypothetical protein